MIAEKVGDETLLAQIIEMVKSASSSRAPIQNLADRISSYFVPIVLSISVITYIVWWQFGPDPAHVYALVNAIAVLIIACPCALGLATPMSVMVGMGKGAQSGVLIKNAEKLEQLSKIDVLVVDKTGTLTIGKPEIQNIKVLADDFSESDVLKYAASLNAHSTHPLAKAFVDAAESKSLSLFNASDIDQESGKGIQGSVDGKVIKLGNDRFVGTNNTISNEDEGNTISWISIDEKVIGYFTISDTVKTLAGNAINELHNNYINIVMLTGDNESSAQKVAEELSIDSYKAHCLPGDKIEEVKRLQEEGKIVAVAGDGTNDALPLLKPISELPWIPEPMLLSNPPTSPC